MVEKKIINSDEGLIAWSIVNRGGNAEVQRIIQELNAELDNQDFQMLVECHIESVTSEESIIAVLRRKMLKRGIVMEEIDAVASMANMVEHLTATQMRDLQELQDAVTRLNRKKLIMGFGKIFADYAIQDCNLAEAIELIQSSARSELQQSTDIDHMEDMKLKAQEPKPMVNSYGIEKIDRYCGGLVVSRMTILAARPGVGKSDYALHVARHNMKLGKNVFIASLEMDTRELSIRMALAEVTNGQTFHERIESGLDNVDAFKGSVSIYDNATASVAQIASRVTPETDLVIVDYLQIIKSRNDSKTRYEQVTEISNDLRAAAKNSNASWLVLSQLSRNARTEKAHPTLADLRESGSIEQDAHAVVFLYLPDGRSEDNDQTVDIDVAKNRGGMTAGTGLLVDRKTHEWRQNEI